MKTALLFFGFLAGALAQSGTVSTALEPNFHDYGSGFSVAGSYNVGDAAATLRIGTGRTFLLGYSRDVLMFDRNGLPHDRFALAGNFQAGSIGGRAALGANLNLVGGVGAYASVYASLARSWGK